MFKIRRGDIVTVIKGKDKGKTGKVLKVFREKNSAIVEGINLVKKHLRRRSQEEQAGIVSIEAPVAISNLMLFCKHCNRPRRVGFTILKDGSKSRICKSCKEVI
ncbi:MAG: 50S ribosomal protein L24 [Candidatus Omnitrophica bacterium]|nr:50S ribosomal protein L24 [Candidatus Omnitrophota bacterium]